MKNFQILDDAHETLEIKEGNNDTISLVQRRRSSILAEWNIKIIILNRKEALLIHHAISDIFLTTS